MVSKYTSPVLTTERQSFWAYAALIAGVFTIGISAIFVRMADAPGIISSFYRMGIASVLVLVPFLKNLHSGPKLSRRGVGFAVLGGIFFGLDLTFWTTGIIMSGATSPTLLVNTAPVWVGLGSWVIFRERQTRRFWIGLLLAVLGATLVVGKDLATAGQFGLGTFFGLLAAVFYGSFYLVSQPARKLLKTLPFFWISTTTSTVFLLLVSWILGYPLTGYDQQTIWLFLAMGVVVQVLGWILINYAQGYLPATLVSPTMLGQPVTTAILAVFLLGENITGWHLAGGLMVLWGVFWVHRSRFSRESTIE